MFRHEKPDHKPLIVIVPVLSVSAPATCIAPQVWFPVPQSKVPLKFTGTDGLVHPEANDTVAAFVESVPPIDVAPVTVKFALVVPSHNVKLPAVMVRLLATVRAKDLAAA